MVPFLYVTTSRKRPLSLCILGGGLREVRQYFTFCFNKINKGDLLLIYFCVFCADVSRIASEIQTKFNAFSEMMSRLGNCENKQGEKYNGVFSVSKKRKWKGKKLYTRYQKL